MITPENTASDQAADSRPTLRFGLRDMFGAIAAIGVSLTPIAYFGADGAAISLAIFVVAILIWDTVRNPKGYSPWVLLLSVCVVGLAAFSSPFGSGPNSPIITSQAQFSTVWSAFKSYQQTNGRYPPDRVTGSDGKPWHSWRVLILKEIDERPLAAAYRHTEPWKGPTNQRLAQAWPPAFECEQSRTSSNRATNVVLVTGPGSAWEGKQPPTAKDLKQLPPDTIVMLEIKNSGIHWMEPRDMTIEEIMKRFDAGGLNGISPHREGLIVVRADGLAVRLPPPINRENFRRLLTVAAE